MNDRGGVGAQGPPEGGVDRVHAARGLAWGGMESAADALTLFVVVALALGRLRRDDVAPFRAVRGAA